VAEKFTSVDAYIESFPEGTQAKLVELRNLIRELLPEADEVISYNIPTFKIGGKYVVYIAGFKDHVSIYPVFDEDSPLGREMAKYRSGKGTLRFPLTEPLPIKLIAKVVKELRKRFEDR
jgi:uncharacterized protein YdhG (YjbR/CyaY superfamily)